jgi:hypothetical protein
MVCSNIICYDNENNKETSRATSKDMNMIYDGIHSYRWPVSIYKKVRMSESEGVSSSSLNLRC